MEVKEYKREEIYGIIELFKYFFYGGGLFIYAVGMLTGHLLYKLLGETILFICYSSIFVLALIYSIYFLSIIKKEK